MKQEVKSREIWYCETKPGKKSVSANQKYLNQRRVHEKTYQHGELVLKYPLGNTKLGPKYEVVPYVVMRMTGTHPLKLYGMGHLRLCISIVWNHIWSKLWLWLWNWLWRDKNKHIWGKNRVISLGGRSNPGVCRQQGNGWSPNKSRCKHILEDLYDILKNLERM